MQTASDEWLLHDRDHQAPTWSLHRPPAQHWALIWFGVPLSLLLLLLLSWSCSCLSGASEASGAGQLCQHPNITQRAGVMWLLHGLQCWGTTGILPRLGSCYPERDFVNYTQ